jgi:hypothetical protein
MTDRQRNPLPTTRAHASIKNVLCALALVCFAGCATGPTMCQKDPTSGSEQCSATSSDPGEAAATAAFAAGAWGVAGCTVNGCLPPYRCNAESKQCERIRCDENKSSCPAGYVCDPNKRVCL